ncbi:MAG: CRISPR-associated helicase Cas3' [Desulfurococcales archaeon]|nr:CRISPR-associated helicase Cas3' [Desulfurococcales archaeon]
MPKKYNTEVLQKHQRNHAKETLSLDEIYKKICSILGWKPRQLIIEGLRRFEEIIRRRGALIIKAPTGYGKTLISLTLYTAIMLGRKDLGFRVIHVLPLRAIGDKFYRDLTREPSEDSKKPGLLWILKNNGLQVDPRDVGLQHMSSRGSPFLAKRYVITTIDTFITSLFKLPVSEIAKAVRRGTAHYEISRGFIYSSTVVLDEFHLYVLQGSLKGERTLTSVISALKGLIDAETPMIIATATLPKKIQKIIEKEIKLEADDAIIEEIAGPAEDMPKRNLKIDLIDYHNADRSVLLDQISDESCKRSLKGSVLVISNTVGDAIDIYSRIRDRVKNIGECGSDVRLLHSRMAKFHRSEVLKWLESSEDEDGKIKKGSILVATQVVEAGVDVSFDHLITEASPPDNLIQRIGRIARRGGEGYIIIYPFQDKSKHVYIEDIVEETIKRIREKKEQSTLELAFEIYDEYINNPQDLLKIDLLRSLYELDRNLSLNHRILIKLLNEFCTLTRDSEILPVITEDLYNLYIKRKDSGDRVKMDDYIVPLDSETIIRNSERIKGFLIDEEIVKLDDNIPKDLQNLVMKFNRMIKSRNADICLSIEMMKYSIDALLIEANYDLERGLILRGDTF